MNLTSNVKPIALLSPCHQMLCQKYHDLSSEKWTQQNTRKVSDLIKIFS